MSRNYWGYRIDTSKADYFAKELDEERLRQGWGYRPEQNLRELKDRSDGAWRNRSILEKVKKGDILLVPRIPAWDKITIVEATEDFDAGYKYEIDPAVGDYGHIFPAKKIKIFNRHNENVSASLQSSLTQRQRFWTMNPNSIEIDNLLVLDEENLRSYSGQKDRFKRALQEAVNASFNETDFKKAFFKELSANFFRAGWETAIAESLQQKYPSPIQVECVGGPAEKNHGTDIKITIPGFCDDSYVIAVQVKDFEGKVNPKVVEQLEKSQIWESDGVKVIDKILVFTKSLRQDNAALESVCKEKGIKVLFSEELKQMLSEMGMKAFRGDL